MLETTASVSPDDSAPFAQSATLFGPSDSVVNVDFSPDDSMIVSASKDGTRVVTAGSDRTARMWDAATGEELWSLGPARAGSSPINGIDVSSDGSTVAVGDDNCNVVIWFD